MHNFSFQDDPVPEKKDPTHYSELDPKSMNVSLNIIFYRFMFLIILHIYHLCIINLILILFYFR